jgi:hypothetical protein
MVIAMGAVLIMQVSAYYVIDMVAMRDRLMSALRVVAMPLVMAFTGVIRCARGRIVLADPDRMLIHMIIVNVMHMAVMQIVRVAFVRNGLMSAAGAVGMVMSFVNRMLIHEAPPIGATLSGFCFGRPTDFCDDGGTR